MIQDIYPEHLDNAFQNIQAQAEDPVLCFAQGCVFAKLSGGRLSFPKRRDFAERRECIYAFSAAGRNWYPAASAARAGSGQCRRPKKERWCALPAETGFIPGSIRQ